MARCLATVSLASLLLAAAPLPARGGASPQRSCQPSGPKARVCYAIDLDELRKSGSTTLRGWIEGTPRPSAIRVHNNSPDIVRFQGGEDRVLHTACKRHSTFRVKVRAISPGMPGMPDMPGMPRLVVRAYDPSPRKEASQIAAELAPLLKAIEMQFLESRSRLLADSPPAAMADLLDTTERSLLAVLSYEELAPLRDSVRMEFRRARLTSGREAALPSSHVMIAALTAVFAATQPSSFDRALDRIEQLVHRLRKIAENDDLMVDICVASAPATGMSFRMYPRYYRTLSYLTQTANVLTHVYRGLYAYEGNRGFRWPFRCDPAASDPSPCTMLDLLNREKEIIHCDVSGRMCYLLLDPAPPPVCRSQTP
jgi:hypothetical protein